MVDFTSEEFIKEYLPHSYHSPSQKWVYDGKIEFAKVDKAFMKKCNHDTHLIDKYRYMSGTKVSSTPYEKEITTNEVIKEFMEDFKRDNIYIELELSDIKYMQEDLKQWKWQIFRTTEENKEFMEMYKSLVKRIVCLYEKLHSYYENKYRKDIDNMVSNDSWRADIYLDEMKMVERKVNVHGNVNAYRCMMRNFGSFTCYASNGRFFVVQEKEREKVIHKYKYTHLEISNYNYKPMISYGEYDKYTGHRWSGW